MSARRSELHDALKELQQAFPILRDRLRATIADEFDVSGTVGEIRVALREDARKLAPRLHETRAPMRSLRVVRRRSVRRGAR